MSGTPSPIGVDDSDDQVVVLAHSDQLAASEVPARRPVVVLVGVPGAGKSTVGHALAERLGVGFRDTDADVEATTGRQIADIFVESGEPEFRRLEASAVAVALDEHDGVLALGGGAVTDPSTRAGLVGCPVVWLRVGLAAASQRAGLSGARPVLLGNVRAQMKALMDARAPLYTEVARLIVDTDDLTVDETVETIFMGLGLNASTAESREDGAPRSVVAAKVPDGVPPASTPPATAEPASPPANPDPTPPANPEPTPDPEARP